MENELRKVDEIMAENQAIRANVRSFQEQMRRATSSPCSQGPPQEESEGLRGLYNSTAFLREGLHNHGRHDGQIYNAQTGRLMQEALALERWKILEQIWQLESLLFDIMENPQDEKVRRQSEELKRLTENLARLVDEQSTEEDCLLQVVRRAIQTRECVAP